MKKYISALVVTLSFMLTGIIAYADSAAPDFKLFGSYYYSSEIKSILVKCLITVGITALGAAIILFIIKVVRKKKNKKEE